jgi:hypothetical protein
MPGQGNLVISLEPAATSFGSARDLANALRRAEAAHGEHEKRTGKAGANWPDWYADASVTSHNPPIGNATPAGPWPNGIPEPGASVATESKHSLGAVARGSRRTPNMDTYCLNRHWRSWPRILPSSAAVRGTGRPGRALKGHCRAGGLREQRELGLSPRPHPRVGPLQDVWVGQMKLP